jgi:hypothetical protein
MLLLETTLTLLALALALAFPNLGRGAFRHIEHGLRRFARRKWLSVFAVMFSCIVIRLALIPLIGIPEPSVHDEFSNLLAADTFAKGRLTNPTHPMWVHFETFHVNHHPTYMSMYPPGNGLIMALGQYVFGHPWYGVLLASGGLCGVITWMLQGWMPPGWALLGGVISVLRIGLYSYWSNSYWGSALAAIGGAMVLGAYPRLAERPTRAGSAALGVGVIVLAITRPYEGLIVCLSLTIPFGKMFFRHWQKGKLPFAGTVAAPVSMALVAGGMWMGYYNYRVFSNPLTPPYVTNRATYAVAPTLILQQESVPPDYRHPVMRDFYLGWERDQYRLARTPSGYAIITSLRWLKFWLFYIYPLFTISLMITAAHLLNVRNSWLFWLIIAANSLAVALSAFTMPHYWAPAAAAIIAILTLSLRLLRVFRIGGRQFGRALVRFLILAGVLLAAVRAVWPPERLTPLLETWYFSYSGFTGRRDLMNRLTASGGKHLIFVRYGERHDPFREWIWNDADIDASPVVWAREMDPEADAELLKYFHGRKAWLLEPDESPLRLMPYPSNALSEH